mgnify:CR=1 FL=1
MINRVVLTGRLARDPELRYTPNGVAVVRFTLAVNRRFTNQQGEREADFIDIVAWRQLAELVANYLKKGRQAAVEGRLQVSSYENSEGRRIYRTEVVADNVQFLDPAGGRQREDNIGMDDFNRGGMEDPFADDGKPIDISDDDLPF